MGDGETAVIEMALASGLALIPDDRRDPRRATTYGAGELMRAALEDGYRRIIVGLGGSATNDGGAGMAAALGARFLDADGNELPPGGAALAGLARVDASALHPALSETTFIGATDVTNPLCGETGASAIFGPQKGATPGNGFRAGRVPGELCSRGSVRPRHRRAAHARLRRGRWPGSGPDRLRRRRTAFGHRHGLRRARL